MIVDLPPPQFDVPYAGKVIELRLGWDELETYCHGKFYACMKDTFIKHGICIIALPKLGPGGVSLYTFLRLRRHEIGHCNGWRHPLAHNHPLS